MKKMGANIFLLVCALFSYQAWQNSQPSDASEARSRAVVCESGCSVLRESPNFMRADPFRHRYEWRTSEGQKTTTCMRKLVFFGAWSCDAEQGRLGRI